MVSKSKNKEVLDDLSSQDSHALNKNTQADISRSQGDGVKNGYINVNILMETTRACTL